MTKKLPDLWFDNIIIWRHAEAELAHNASDEADEIRQLTPKGGNQAKCMAHWLKKHLLKETLRISSPALRALQTAKAFSEQVQLQDGLKPNASLCDVITTLAAIQHQLDLVSPKMAQKNVLIIGHQPWLGQLVTHLLTQHLHDAAQKMYPDNMTSIKKGAVWWLRLYTMTDSAGVEQQYKLLTVQTPSLLP